MPKLACLAFLVACSRPIDKLSPPEAGRVEPAELVVSVGKSKPVTLLVGNTPALATWTSDAGTVDADGVFTAGATPGTFTLTATSAGISAQAKVRVVALPTSPRLTASVSAALVDDMLTLQVADPPAGTTYQWTVLDAVLLTPANGNDVTVLATKLGTITAIVTPTNEAGDAGTPGVLSVRVVSRLSEALTPTLSAPDKVKAGRARVQARVVSPNAAVHYEWEVENATLEGEAIGEQITLTAPTGGDFIVRVRASNDAAVTEWVEKTVATTNVAIEILAGTPGGSGFADGPPGEARLGTPSKMFYSPGDDMLYVVDNNHVLRIAGDGTSMAIRDFTPATLVAIGESFVWTSEPSQPRIVPWPLSGGPSGPALATPVCYAPSGGPLLRAVTSLGTSASGKLLAQFQSVITSACYEANGSTLFSDQLSRVFRHSSEWSVAESAVTTPLFPIISETGNTFYAHSNDDPAQLVKANFGASTFSDSGAPLPDGATVLDITTNESPNVWVGVSTASGASVYRGFASPTLLAQVPAINGLAAKPNGDLFIADGKNHVVRLLSGGTLSTFAGTAEGISSPGCQLGQRPAGIRRPTAITIGVDGVPVYFDTGTCTVRKLRADGSSEWLSGSGASGQNPGFPTSAAFRANLAVLSAQADGSYLYAYADGTLGLRRLSATGVATIANVNETALGIAASPKSGILYVKNVSNELIAFIDGAAIKAFDLGPIIEAVPGLAIGPQTPAGDSVFYVRRPFGEPLTLRQWSTAGETFVACAGMPTFTHVADLTYDATLDTLYIADGASIWRLANVGSADCASSTVVSGQQGLRLPDRIGRVGAMALTSGHDLLVTQPDENAILVVRP